MFNSCEHFNCDLSKWSLNSVKEAANMFYDCKALTSAPRLPKTELKNQCYSSMFAGCISLVEAPELPATKLSQLCYYSMFSGCTSL